MNRYSNNLYGVTMAGRGHPLMVALHEVRAGKELAALQLVGEVKDLGRD